jgi:streptogramin lyase
VVLDKGGTVWFSDFGENMLGEMDAKTGAVIEHHYDVSRLRGDIIAGSSESICFRVVRRRTWLGCNVARQSPT